MMTCFRSVGPLLKSLALTAVWWTAAGGMALAARGAPKEPPKSGGAAAWTFPYFLVILAVGMGMLFVCRSSRRRDRAKPESFEAGSIEDELSA